MSCPNCGGPSKPEPWGVKLRIGEVKLQLGDGGTPPTVTADNGLTRVPHGGKVALEVGEPVVQADGPRLAPGRALFTPTGGSLVHPNDIGKPQVVQVIKPVRRLSLHDPAITEIAHEATWRERDTGGGGPRVPWWRWRRGGDDDGASNNTRPSRQFYRRILGVFAALVTVGMALVCTPVVATFTATIGATLIAAVP